MQEITINDEFGQALAKYSNGTKCAVEIGGGAGDGSTQCIKSKKLYSFEFNSERKHIHSLNLSDRIGGVAIHEMSSNPNKWMTKDQVIRFYNTIHTNLNQYSIQKVLGWLEADLLMASKYIFQSVSIEEPIDFLLLDGGAFSGNADREEWFPRLINDGYVALDDINDIKNYESYEWLKSNNYECVWECKTLRNGSAIFKK
jgi:predicted O-methyltransferase YrrM